MERNGKETFFVRDETDARMIRSRLSLMAHLLRPWTLVLLVFYACWAVGELSSFSRIGFRQSCMPCWRGRHRSCRRRLSPTPCRESDSLPDGPGWSQQEMWQQELRRQRSMEYVSMPIRRFTGHPREQLMVALTFPAVNQTLCFALDTLSRETIVTLSSARALLGFPAAEPQQYGMGVQLPAARLGAPDGDHFFVVLNAIVASREQVRTLGPNTGGVLGLDFLKQYDLDINFAKEEARFYASGAVDQALIDTSGLEALSCSYLPGGKMGIKMELNGGGRFTGVLDVKSNSSAGNWAAARDLDVTSLVQGHPSSYPPETGRTRPLFRAHFDTIQLGHVLLASVVDAPSPEEGLLTIYIGHLSEFEWLAEDISGRSVSSGRQLALVGLDLVGGSRMVLSCKSERLFFKPRDLNDFWANQIA